MRPTSNVHTHCTWCDGTGTPRQMAEAALALGFTDLGFSSHSPAPFDPRCAGLADEAAYRADIARLKDEYAGRLSILCGIEQDLYAPVDDAANYDYVIASVHYLPPADGRYDTVDGEPEELEEIIARRHGGDSLALAKEYYATVAGAVHQLRPAIVGHFDLLTKFNREGRYFDEESPAYQKAALDALDDVLDVLAGYGGMVEVNTGAMAKGYLSRPYPDAFLLRHMAQRGARAIITSDSHSPATLAYGFEETTALLRAAGFEKMAMLRGGAFVDVPV